MRRILTFLIRITFLVNIITFLMSSLLLVGEVYIYIYIYINKLVMRI